MDVDRPRHQDDPSGLPLVLSGRPSSYRGRRMAAVLYIVIAPAFATIFLLAAWIIGTVVAYGTGAVFGLLTMAACFLATLGFSAVLLMLGVKLMRMNRRLDRLRLRIGPDGIAGASLRGIVPWERIRHVAITEGEPGLRRLIIDDGTGRPVRSHDVHLGVWGRVRMSLLDERFAVDVPIDLLDAEAGDVIRAIRHCSGGRFPDL
jgi:hypothetical protein